MNMKKLDETLLTMNGKYFGITRTNGSKINARLRSVSPSYLVVEDRNSKTDIKLAKASISSISTKGQVIR